MARPSLVRSRCGRGVSCKAALSACCRSGMRGNCNEQIRRNHEALARAFRVGRTKACRSRSEYPKRRTRRSRGNLARRQHLRRRQERNRQAARKIACQFRCTRTRPDQTERANTERANTQRKETLMNLKELQTINQIAERAVKLYLDNDLLDEKNRRFALSGITHELTMVHEKVVPLRLDEMLSGTDFDLAHDVGGIHRHLDYGTKTNPPHLTSGFLPRYAKV